MSKLEHRLFFYLLRRWADRKSYLFDSPNGVVMLMRNRDYDLKITKDKTLRKDKS